MRLSRPGDSGQTGRPTRQTARISVVHYIPGLHVRDGGPSRSVVALTDSLASDDALEIALLSHKVQGFETLPSHNERVRRVEGLAPDSIQVKLGLVDRALFARHLEESDVDLVHTHCLWHPANHWGMRLAQRAGVPVICQPRGMLEPWALNYRRWKKEIAMALFQRTDLERTACFVATSTMEAESIRRMGIRKPIAIIPNGVEMTMPSPGPALAGRTIRSERELLFLSRIHPVKGILTLVKAWSRCQIPGWRLIIAGPDSGGHLSEVLRLVEDLGLADTISIIDEVRGDAKAERFRSADLFVLPSFGENFGIVVAEALAGGVPVITTRATPWEQLVTHECGWWIDVGEEPLVAALREAMALSDEGRAEMGRRGARLAMTYKWETAARDTAAVYRWLLGRGERPDCVLND